MAKTRRPIGRIFSYLRYFPSQIAGNVLFNILAIVFNLSSYALIVPFIELLFGFSDPPATAPQFAMSQEAISDLMLWKLYEMKGLYGAWQSLAIVAVGYLGCSLLSNLFRFMAYYFLSPIRNGVTEHLRNDLYHKITILPISFFNSRRKGDLISRLSNDLVDVEWSVVSTLESLVKAPIQIVIFVITLLFVSPRLFLYFLMVLPLLVFLIAVIGKSLKRNANKGQIRLGGLFSLIEESLNGVRVIKSFGQERGREKAFCKANEEYSRTMVKVAVRRELSSPLSEIIGTVGLVAILILGGALVIEGEIRSSVFIFFVIVFARLIPPVLAVVRAYNSLQKGSASAARFLEILDAEEKVVEKPSAVAVKGFESEICYDKVSFSYTEEDGREPVYVLRDIDLTVAKGKTIAVVGPSGAGKTTLVDLLPRFYDCTQGEIRIDGVPIREVNINTLREQMGIVSQNCILFNDSVANNIAFGDTAMPIEAIREAAAVAHAAEFIEALPQGYNTHIGDRGVSLSGGQRQRLSIARAVLKNPPILILDEATSALDAESEQAVQQALDHLMQNRTTIVIAHRLSTIQNADQILVLDRGKIVQQGTHSDLMRQQGLYRQLVDMQSFA